MPSEPAEVGAPPHPGLTVRSRVRPGFELPVSRAARELGLARQKLHRLLAGTTATTPEMAARLARLSRVPAGHWLGRQQAHDLWRAEHALADALRRIPARTLPGPLRQEIGASPHG